MTSSVVVGRYRLDEPSRPEVDASTWTASDLAERRKVVVCLCANETGSAARSRRSTSHPGLTPVFDVVRLRDGVLPPLESADPRGELFVVLDAPVGAPLDASRAVRAFDSKLSVEVAIALSDALAFVHEKGSVHGGVCPAAVEIRPLDKGGPRLGLRGIGDLSMAYSSPSRLCDGGPSTHDDAWGLLGVLYFMLTGSAPFSAESPAALARRVLGGRPIPIKVAGPGDADLQKIFDRGFSRTAAQRYGDVAAVAQDLRGWLGRFGAELAKEAIARATTSTLPPPEGGPTPLEIPVGRSVRPPASVPSQPPPAPATPTEPPATPSEPPKRASIKAPPTNEETVRFSREQLDQLEAERESARAARLADTTARASDSKPPDDKTDPSIDVHALLASRAKAENVEVERAEPSPARPARSMPPPTSSGSRTLLLAFGGGLIAAVLAGVGYVALRPPSRPTPATTTTTASPTAEPPRTATAIAKPPVSATTTASAAPTHSASPTPSTTASAHAAPSATSGSSQAPVTGGAGACVRAMYGDGTFTDEADLSFVCDEPIARKATQRLQRAIVSGGRGRSLTPAMREWSQLRWFEIPVLETLRAQCCAAATTELPSVSPLCAAPNEVIAALVAAGRNGADLDEPVRNYRKLVSCLVNTGDVSAFGQDGLMTGGEDTAFRAFVARSHDKK